MCHLLAAVRGAASTPCSDLVADARHRRSARDELSSWCAELGTRGGERSISYPPRVTRESSLSRGVPAAGGDHAHPHRAEPAEPAAAGRGAAVPLAAARAPRRRLGARGAHGRGLHGLARRQAGPAAEPVLGARGAARPGRGPALHPRRAGGPRGARRRALVGRRRARRPRPRCWRPACRCCGPGGTARSGCSTWARARRSCCSTPSRCCCSGPATSPVAAVARPLGYAFAVWGTGLYLYSGLVYLAQFVLALRRAGHGPPTGRGAVIDAGS